MDNLEETDEFSDIYNLPRLNQEVTENLNRPITSNKIESLTEKLPTHKSSRPDSLTGEFYHTVKELVPMFPKLFQKLKRKERFQTHSTRSALP